MGKQGDRNDAKDETRYLYGDEYGFQTTLISAEEPGVVTSVYPNRETFFCSAEAEEAQRKSAMKTGSTNCQSVSIAQLRFN